MNRLIVAALSVFWSVINSYGSISGNEQRALIRSQCFSILYCDISYIMYRNLVQSRANVFDKLFLDKKNKYGFLLLDLTCKLNMWQTKQHIWNRMCLFLVKYKHPAEWTTLVSSAEVWMRGEPDQAKLVYKLHQEHMWNM